MIALDIIALVSSVAAATLGVTAIVQSLGFYRMSIRLAEEARQTQRDLGGSLTRLDRLFDTLYRDALTMMKESAGRRPDAADAAERMARLKSDIVAGVSTLLSRRGAAGDAMAVEMTEIIDRAIEQSHQGM